MVEGSILTRLFLSIGHLFRGAVLLGFGSFLDSMLLNNIVSIFILIFAVIVSGVQWGASHCGTADAGTFPLALASHSASRISEIASAETLPACQ
jgi:hypothetical protein